MDSRYIIRIDNSKLIFFYYEKSNIFMREMENGIVVSESKAVEGVRENYTITLCKNGEIYLFCQSISGDIIQVKLKEKSRSQSIILKNNGKMTGNILFYCIENGSQMSLIYNIPSVSSNFKGSYDIMKQIFDGKSGWTSPEKIDTIIGMNEFIFKLYVISHGSGIIFYQKTNGSGENGIGYREFNINEMGNYNSIYLTNYRISAASFLAAENGIHFIFAVKNIFSTRIIYRKKDSSGIKDYIVLSETNQIESCELFIIKSKLYAFWKTTMGLFYCISEDNGNSFSKPYKYTINMSEGLKMTTYLSFPKMTEKNYFTESLYTSNNNICDIKILPELYDNFIPKGSQNLSKNTVQDIYNVAKNETDSEIHIKNTRTSQNTNIVEMLKNQVNMLNSQLNFKDKQIEQLTASLKRKNEEILLNDRVWREKYKKALNENNTLTEKNSPTVKKSTESNVSDTEKELSENNISEKETISEEQKN